MLSLVGIFRNLKLETASQVTLRELLHGGRRVGGGKEE